jgi:hypothetical protein
MSFITYIFNHRTWYWSINLHPSRECAERTKLLDLHGVCQAECVDGSRQGLYSIFCLVIIWINTNTIHNHMNLFFTCSNCLLKFVCKYLDKFTISGFDYVSYKPSKCKQSERTTSQFHGEMLAIDSWNILNHIFGTDKTQRVIWNGDKIIPAVRLLLRKGGEVSVMHGKRPPIFEGIPEIRETTGQAVYV